MEIKSRFIQAGGNPLEHAGRISGLRRFFSGNRIALGACVLACAALLSACATSTTTPTPTPNLVPLLPAAPLPTNPPAAPTASVTPGPIDPCVLVTSQDASTLTGATYGPGKEDTTPGGGRICWYGYQTLNVFMVLVGQEKDAATAHTDLLQLQAELQAKMPEITSMGITVTQLPTFADGAAYARGSASFEGQTISGSDFGFVKGAVFVGLADLATGNNATSTDALQTEATTLLGQLP